MMTIDVATVFQFEDEQCKEFEVVTCENPGSDDLTMVMNEIGPANLQECCPGGFSESLSYMTVIGECRAFIVKTCASTARDKT